MTLSPGNIVRWSVKGRPRYGYGMPMVDNIPWIIRIVMIISIMPATGRRSFSTDMQVTVFELATSNIYETVFYLTSDDFEVIA